MRVSALRLHNQLVSRQPFRAPSDVVAWFGAVQAQDYLAARWAIGLRTDKGTEAVIEAALAEGSVIRTHAFRGTWQFVTPGDLRWMLALVGARVIASAASRFRELGLDGRTLARSSEHFAMALSGGRELTRRELAAVLSRRRIDASGARLLHMLGHAELGGVICSGARRGKQPTFALLEERVPKARSLPREEALAELAKKYFRSRGPATERDFAWWTGLPLRDVREAIELAQASLQCRKIDGQPYWFAESSTARPRGTSLHLLPAFDECLIAYQDRSAFIDDAHVRKVNAGGGMLQPVVLSEGRIVGTWQRKLEKRAVSIVVRPFRRLSASERNALSAAADRYAEFLDLKGRVSVRM